MTDEEAPPLTDLFFSDFEEDKARAKAICSSCPVRQDCYDAAAARREPWGVWGGVEFPTEWRRLRRVAAKARSLVTRATEAA